MRVRKQPRRAGSGDGGAGSGDPTPDPAPSSPDPASGRLGPPESDNSARARSGDEGAGSGDSRQIRLLRRRIWLLQGTGLSNTTWFDLFRPVRARRAALLARGSRLLAKEAGFLVTLVPGSGDEGAGSGYLRIRLLRRRIRSAVPLEFPYCFSVYSRVFPCIPVFRVSPGNPGYSRVFPVFPVFPGIPGIPCIPGNKARRAVGLIYWIIRPVGPLALLLVYKARRAKEAGFSAKEAGFWPKEAGTFGQKKPALSAKSRRLFRPKVPCFIMTSGQKELATFGQKSLRLLTKRSKLLLSQKQ